MKARLGSLFFTFRGVIDSVTCCLPRFCSSQPLSGGWQKLKPESGQLPLSAAGSSGGAVLGGERGGVVSEARLGLLSAGQSGGKFKREATFHLRSLLFPARRDLTGGCSQRAVLHL